MNFGIIYVIFLCIWNSILLFDNDMGINVFLFTLPLLLYLFYIFKNNNLIKNKFGLLLFIPILLLSLHYTFFNNIFNQLNILVLPCLYGLFYIFTIKPTNNLITLLYDLLKVFLFPLDYCEKVLKESFNYFSSVIKLTDNKKRIFKSIIIVVPIVIIVLILLSSADKVFSNLFNGFLVIFNNISIFEISRRIVFMFLLFIYIGCCMYYLINKYRDSLDNKTNTIIIDDYTIKLLITILNIIYIVFDIIQIRSLLLHRISNNIIYSEYARSGFFQLMFISFINITIILISKNSKKSNYTIISSIIMVLLTLVIIFSSMYRMYMYETSYGYTVLRLGVYALLISELILLVPTIIYIIKDKFNVLKYYVIICITIYTLINFIPVNYVIARKNIDRYYKTNKLDLVYLEDYNYENVSILKELYNKTDDFIIKSELDDYFGILRKKAKYNIFEYNIFREKVFNLLK